MVIIKQQQIFSWFLKERKQKPWFTSGFKPTTLGTQDMLSNRSFRVQTQNIHFLHLNVNAEK